MKSLFALAPLALMLVAPLVSHAQVAPAPPLMNFQGRLANPDGTPVPDGTYSIRFSFWDTLADGTEQWNQTVDAITVKNGVFSTVLLVDTPGLFNNDLWLEIKIGDNDPLSPRQRFVSVAYAMKAGSVADGSVTAASIVDGSITADKFESNLFNAMGWILSGNSGTNPASHFLGTTDNQPLTVRVNNRRAIQYQYAQNTEYRGINVLGGSELNSISAGVVGATVSGGGWDNNTGTDYPNRVTVDFGTVGGGFANTAGYASIVAGGNTNTAGNVSFVGGGSTNTATGSLSVIGGGYLNSTTNSYATVSGGYLNNATNNSATVGGGYFNNATGTYATIAGGYANTASGFASFAGGYNSKANHNGSFVWNDVSTGLVFASTDVNQFCINATGGVKLGLGTYLDTGFGASGRESSAGKIGYALFTAGALDIVGAGTVGNNRKIKLWAEGGVTATGSYTNISDARFKRNIALLPDALQDILDLRGVTFNWKPTRGMNFSDRNQIGFIAQEVEMVLPDLVFTDEGGYKSVNYIGVVPVLVEAVKPQQKQIETLRTKVATLETQNATLFKQNEELSALKKQLATLATTVQKLQEHREGLSPR